MKNVISETQMCLKKFNHEYVLRSSVTKYVRRKCKTGDLNSNRDWSCVGEAKLHTRYKGLDSKVIEV